jgi:3'-phosphoadenosine 5'-phosphosulfate sulfotransferase (PAPS reductase)/FAD synthetase
MKNLINYKKFETKISNDLLHIRQDLPLQAKILLTEKRLIEYYDKMKGNIYLAFSGGRDSTLLREIYINLFPKASLVFCNTGLEYPEIIEFIKSLSNITWVKPKITFKQVIEKYGYPVISKQVSRYLHDLKNSTDKNKATCNLRLTGYNRKGIYCPSMKLSKKWLYLINAPFKISDKCCYCLKQQPLDQYKKETGRFPIMGIRIQESNQRLRKYKEHGCNAFNLKNPVSWPIAFWTDKDIYDYIKQNNIKYSKIYDMGEKRTGCMYCLYGIHLEKDFNRMQRMKIYHPKQWDFCINKLNEKQVLDYIKIKYE